MVSLIGSHYGAQLEKPMAPHSSTLAWKIPWIEEPGGLQSMGSLRVEHDWATSLSLFTFMHWRRKWQPTPVFLPGESQGWGSLVGCHLWGSHRAGNDWSNLAAAAAVFLSGQLKILEESITQTVSLESGPSVQKGWGQYLGVKNLGHEIINEGHRTWV